MAHAQWSSETRRRSIQTTRSAPPPCAWRSATSAPGRCTRVTGCSSSATTARYAADPAAPLPPLTVPPELGCFPAGVPVLPFQVPPELPEEAQPAEGALDQGLPPGGGQGAGGGEWAAAGGGLGPSVSEPPLALPRPSLLSPRRTGPSSSRSGATSP